MKSPEILPGSLPEILLKDSRYHPRPIFDTLPNVLEQHKILAQSDDPASMIRQWLNTCFSSTVTLTADMLKDYQWVLNFLYTYRGSSDTFNAYRRDLERLIQWSWFVRQQSIFKHKREDIEALVEFFIKPHKNWMGLKTAVRFKNKDGQRHPNPEWHPFIVAISKKDHKLGLKPKKQDYQFSKQALKALFAILGSFYNYLLQEDLVQANPVTRIRQKSKFLQKNATAPQIRRLSNKQWETVIQLVEQAADKTVKYERDLFIFTCLYSMYLRISEMITTTRWAPTMGDFYKDSDGNWWFKTVGKGNKLRQIAVSPVMKKGLERYRIKYLQLSPLPTLNDKIPLISHITNTNKPITCQRPIRQLVQGWFDRASEHLERSNQQEESEALKVATVHWLRHTGISDDVKIRPREHVRDDAGHSSSAITDRYIDIGLKERAQSARKKKSISIKEKQTESINQQ